MVGSYDRSTGKIVNNKGETSAQKSQRCADAKQGIGSHRNSDKGTATNAVYRDAQGGIVDVRAFVVSAGSAQEQAKRQQFQQSFGGGGTQQLIKLTEKISI